MFTQHIYICSFHTDDVYTCTIWHHMISYRGMTLYTQCTEYTIIMNKPLEEPLTFRYKGWKILKSLCTAAGTEVWTNGILITVESFFEKVVLLWLIRSHWTWIKNYEQKHFAAYLVYTHTRLLCWPFHLDYYSLYKCIHVYICVAAYMYNTPWGKLNKLQWGLHQAINQPCQWSEM